MRKAHVSILAAFLASAAAFAGNGEIVKPDGDLIPDSYIVVFNDVAGDARDLAEQLAATHRGRVARVYNHAFKGAHMLMPEQAARGLAHNPLVDYVEQDVRYELDGAQVDATWGLDRVDQRALPLNNTYHWDFDGTGVRAFVLDTGIRTTHQDFGGRASWGLDCTGEGQNDGFGHGTHVAGTIGSATYGVAKNVRLVAVKVCNRFGGCSLSDINCGVDYVVQQKQASGGTPMVANMSLGGPVSQSLNDTVASGVAAGVFFAVSAGNNNFDACLKSPASEPTAYTVGASDEMDERSFFSNFGTCVDIFAPGSNIVSTWNTSDTAVLNGTSMASPHATGAAALVLDQHPAWTPAQVDAALDARSTQGALSLIGAGSPNRLLHTLGGGGAPPPPPEIIGQRGRVSGLTHQPQTVLFSHSYKNPVVFAQPATANGSDATAVRVVDVRPDRFTLYLDEPPNLDGSHAAAETVSYLVLEAGNWVAAGQRLSVGSVTTSKTVGTLIANEWQRVGMVGFGQIPVMLTQVQTNWDPSWVKTRVQNVSNTGFDVALEEEESSTAGHGTEVIGWLAFRPGASNWDGKRYEAVRTPVAVTHGWYTIPFLRGMSDIHFLAGIESYRGSDPSHLRYRNLGNFSVDVRVEEDTTRDSETAHTQEVVAYVAIAGSGLLSAVPWP